MQPTTEGAVQEIVAEVDEAETAVTDDGAVPHAALALEENATGATTVNRDASSE